MDIKAKKILLKSIPCGLYMVGMSCKKIQHFFVATWISQCSIKPPAVSIALKKKSFAHELIKDKPFLSLNYFSKNDQDFIQSFMKKKNKTDLDCFKTTQGALVLKRAVAYLEFSQWTIYSTQGDHAILFASIKDAHIQNKDDFFHFDPLTLQDTPWTYGG